MSDKPDRQRIDRWLFFARIVKSRSLAAKLVRAGGVRVNREKVGQPSAAVKIGDVLTVTLQRRVLVLKIADPGVRRGPAPEARTLYEDLSPAPATTERDAAEGRPAERDPGTGRPSKKQRRDLEKWKSESGPE